MSEYIGKESFITAKRKHYCADCDRRKGMKNGKMRFCYDIGDAPCRSCSVDDMLDDIENFPAADVVEVVRCGECKHRDEITGWCEDVQDYISNTNWFCAGGEKKGGADDDR